MNAALLAAAASLSCLSPAAAWSPAALFTPKGLSLAHASTPRCPALRAGLSPLRMADASTPEYTDETEDRTAMEGHVTTPGEVISKFAKIVRPDLIEDATAEGDVTNEEYDKEYFKVYGCKPDMSVLYDDDTRGQEGWTSGTAADGEVDDGPPLSIAERYAIEQNKQRRRKMAAEAARASEGAGEGA
mmetsp:Transcript_9010/g.21078  ORF Transcript_9010/g.21078 Transcript_9010/m.21078 type:complete len:187 (-) Transcript_9010:264-824(-)